MIEKIQRRFIKMIPRFKDLSCEEELRILILNTLEERRNSLGQTYLFSSRCTKNCLVLHLSHYSNWQTKIKLEVIRWNLQDIAQTEMYGCTSSLSSLREWLTAGTNLISLSSMLAVWTRSNEDFMHLGMTGWTCSRINNQFGFRPDQDFLLVRLYQVNYHGKPENSGLTGQ